MWRAQIWSWVVLYNSCFKHRCVLVQTSLTILPRRFYSMSMPSITLLINSFFSPWLKEACKYYRKLSCKKISKQISHDEVDHSAYLASFISHNYPVNWTSCHSQLQNPSSPWQLLRFLQQECLSSSTLFTSRVFPLCLSHGTCEINLLNQISKLEVRPHHSTFASWKQITQYLNSKPRVWIISFTFKSLYSFPVYSRIQPHCALYLPHHHDSTCPIMNRKHSVRRNKS